MIKPQRPDLPSYITNVLSPAVIDLIMTETNNINLFRIIGDIIPEINTLYPNLSMVLMRDKLEKITCESEEYFIQEPDPINYKNDSIKSYSLIINLDIDIIKVKDQETQDLEQNVVILRNDLEHSSIEALRTFKTFLKATVLISNNDKALSTDSLIIKFKSTNKISVVSKKLIDAHPSSLFNLKFYFNNNSSNVLYLEEVDYEHFSIVLKSMKGDLEAFSENKQLMDFLGLTLNSIKAIFLTSFKNDCLFVNTIQQYISIKNLLNGNDNVVPIQVSYATFNIKHSTETLWYCINKEQILLNISVMDGAPIYVGFCDKASKDTYYSNKRLDPLSCSYESLRREMLSVACKPHDYQVVNKIKESDLSGGPEEYINTLLVICKSLVHKVWYGSISEYSYAKRNHIDSPLNMTLLGRACDKLDNLGIKENKNIFSSYFLEPTQKKQIGDIINFNQRVSCPYTIGVVSYFGFLKLD